MARKIRLCGATILLLIFSQNLSYAAIDCKKGLITPTEADLGKYAIIPWYVNEENMYDALVSIQTRTDYEESLLAIKPVDSNNNKEEKDRPKRSSSGSVESEIILGLTDFIVDRAKAEAIQWYMTDIQNTLCGGEYRVYFNNTCVMQSQSKETLPFLPGLVEAFRKDMEILPAGLLCNYDATDKGYYLINLVKHLIGGSPVENTLAGLAENKKISAECSSETISLKQSTCDLYIAGLFAQAYLKWDKTQDWKAAMKFIDNSLTAKGLNNNFQDIHEQKQFLLYVADRLRDMRLQVKKLMRAKKEGNQEPIIADAALKLGEDVAELIDNPLYRSLPGVDGKSVNYVKPAIKAMNAARAGRYSEALLDFNKIISEYNNQFENINERLQQILVERVVDFKGIGFEEKNFVNARTRTSLCVQAYGSFYPAEHHACDSVDDLNQLLEHDDYFEMALNKNAQYEKMISALIMIYYNLDNGPGSAHDAQKKMLLRIINRLVLERDSGIPRSQFCYKELLEAYYDWFNPDTVKKARLA